MEKMPSVDEFIRGLTTLSKFDLLEAVRQQANVMAKEGNLYFPALLREIATRYEISRAPFSEGG